MESGMIQTERYEQVNGPVAGVCLYLTRTTISHQCSWRGVNKEESHR